MLVTLPSGATAPLDVPSLPSLLAAGGDIAAIAAAAFAHDEVGVDELWESDLYFVASWALAEFAAEDEGLELAVVADAWKRSPAQMLGLSDLELAWELERNLYLRLANASAPAETSDLAEGGIHFVTPEVVS